MIGLGSDKNTLKNVPPIHLLVEWRGWVMQSLKPSGSQVPSAEKYASELYKNKHIDYKLQCILLRSCQHSWTNNAFIWICLFCSHLSSLKSIPSRELFPAISIEPRFHHTACLVSKSLIFSCPGQLNRWPCHSLTHIESVSESMTHLLSLALQLLQLLQLLQWLQ